MTRGTTPTITFTIDNLDYSLLNKAELTIRQLYKNVLIKDLDILENEMQVTFTEEETLQMKAGVCELQIKLLFNSGEVLATNIVKTSVEEILNEGKML